MRNRRSQGIGTKDCGVDRTDPTPLTIFFSLSERRLTASESAQRQQHVDDDSAEEVDGHQLKRLPYRKQCNDKCQNKELPLLACELHQMQRYRSV
jgi:hypothetical protein